MNRRDFITSSALTAAAVALGPHQLLRAQRGGGPPEVTPVFTELRRNTGFFTGRGGTIGYLVTPDGVAVVDSQFPDSAPLCLEGLAERSGLPTVDVLVNTH